MKKISAIVIGLMLSISIVGCGNTATTKTDTSKKESTTSENIVGEKLLTIEGSDYEDFGSYKATFYKETANAAIRANLESEQDGNTTMYLPQDLYDFIEATYNKKVVESDIWSSLIRQLYSPRSYSLLYNALYYYGNWAETDEPTYIFMVGDSQENGALRFLGELNDEGDFENYVIQQIYFENGKPIITEKARGALSKTSYEILKMFIEQYDYNACDEFNEVMQAIIDKQHLKYGIEVCEKYLHDQEDSAYYGTYLSKIGPYYDKYETEQYYKGKFYQNESGILAVIESSVDSSFDIVLDTKVQPITEELYNVLTSKIAKETIKDDEWGTFLYYIGINHTAHVEASIAAAFNCIDLDNVYLIAPSQDKGILCLYITEEKYNVQSITYEKAESEEMSGFAVNVEDVEADLTHAYKDKHKISDLVDALKEVYQYSSLDTDEYIDSEIMYTLREEGLDAAVNLCKDIVIQYQNLMESN